MLAPQQPDLNWILRIRYLFFAFHTDFLEVNDLILGGWWQGIMPGGLSGDSFLYTFDQIDNLLYIMKDFN